MNIDILNAHCGVGFARRHICLRVGFHLITRARRVPLAARASVFPRVRWAVVDSLFTSGSPSPQSETGVATRTTPVALLALAAVTSVRVGQTVARLFLLGGHASGRLGVCRVAHARDLVVLLSPLTYERRALTSASFFVDLRSDEITR